jgi:hypothetical protein
MHLCENIILFMYNINMYLCTLLMMFSHIQMGGLGLTIACTIGAGALGISALSIPFVLPAFRRVCLPYVPATEKQIENVKSLLGKYHKMSILADGPKIIDLGSGDGRVVSSIYSENHTGLGCDRNKKKTR